MKKLPSRSRNTRAKQVACTVSAAALMLGVSPAATVAMHFQENYCGSAAYSGFPVTLTAFGIAPNGWQNLIPMNSGYGPCKLTAPPYGYTLSETINTTTSTNGLNPLPHGSITVNWFGPTANFSGFGGYAGNPPSYNYGGAYPNPATTPTGEEQIYATFLRDGVNFGPPGGADNTSGVGGYTVDITGLKSVFTNSSFVIELIAASDSMQKLTNAFVIDATALTTNSVTYPNTPTVADAGGAPWVRGQGGGLSTVSGALNTDHVKIMSNLPQHGGTGTPPTGFDNAGTISGFIITDKPVVTMSARSVAAYPGDMVTLNPYAIGVPPLAYQWRLNGKPVSGATNLSYTIASLGLSQIGNYDLVITNAFGSATSSVATVTGDITIVNGNNFVADSNPANPPRVGRNSGATWLASSSDGTTTRSGVMQFVATNANGISVAGSTNFDSTTGTFAFWMRSAGVDPNSSGSLGAALFGRPGTSLQTDLVLIQQDNGTLYFNAASATGTANGINSGANISDNHWHLIALTYDQSASGGVALYVDGVLDTTNANSDAWGTKAGVALQIGFTTDGTLRDYNGLLDDVRVYNRQLTAAEVSSVHSTGALVDTNALQMRLNFDTAPGFGFTLNWTAANSVLQSAPTAQGPYTDVPGAISPYSVVPSGNQKFFRYRYPTHVPQTITSNPYLM